MAVTINGSTGISGVDGSAATPALQGGDTNTGIIFGTDTVGVSTGGVQRTTVDSSGRLLVGTSSARTILTGYVPTVQIESGTGAAANLSIVSTENAAVGGNFWLGHGRGANGLVNDGDDLGAILFNGGNGTNIQSIGAKISTIVDGTPSASSMPGRIVFATTPTGASSPTERMRIRATGVVGTSRGMVIGSLAGGINDDALIISSAVIASGAGTNALKWNSSTGVVTYDTSSRLIKEEIIDCPYGIDELKQLQPRKYFRIDDQREEIGFIADEVVDLMPEFVPVGPKSVITRNDQDTEVIPLGVNYDKLTAVLTKALQEAIGRIETLEAEVVALKAQ